jgi:hypothetical protein
MMILMCVKFANPRLLGVMVGILHVPPSLRPFPLVVFEICSLGCWGRVTFLAREKITSHFGIVPQSPTSSASPMGQKQEFLWGACQDLTNTEYHNCRSQTSVSTTSNCQWLTGNARAVGILPEATQKLPAKRKVSMNVCYLHGGYPCLLSHAAEKRAFGGSSSTAEVA